MSDCQVTIIDELWHNEELNTVGIFVLYYLYLLILFFSNINYILLFEFLLFLFLFYKIRTNMDTTNMNGNCISRIVNYKIASNVSNDNLKFSNKISQYK